MFRTIMGKFARNEIVILIAEDDDGHAELIIDNLREAGLTNEIIRFRDGQEALDFLTGTPDTENSRQRGTAYLLLVDIRMPPVDGVEVLRRSWAVPGSWPALARVRVLRQGCEEETWEQGNRSLQVLD